MEVAGIVLTGRASRRMGGRAKASLPVGSTTLAARTAALVGAMAHPTPGTWVNPSADTGDVHKVAAQADVPARQAPVTTASTRPEEATRATMNFPRFGGRLGWGDHSDLAYDGRLRPADGREQQNVTSAGPLTGHGLRLVAVDHTGMAAACPPEAHVVAELWH